MPNRSDYLWVFFKWNGRVGRAVYVLAGLLAILLPSFLLYQVLLAPEGSPAAQFWTASFSLAFLVSLWSHLALGAKRLHDLGKPGILSLSLFVPVVSILVFAALCVFPGNPGRNEYGERSDAAG